MVAPLSISNSRVLELSAFEILLSVLIAGTAAYVWDSRRTPVGRYLLLMLLGASGYTFASGAHVFISNPTVAHVVHNGTYAFGALLTAAGTLMIIAFTGREGLQRRWFVGLLCGFVLVDVFTAVTDPWFGAIIRELVFVEGGALIRTAEYTGAYFWVRNSGLFILAALSLLLILLELSDADGFYRKQLSLLAAGQAFVISMFLIQLILPSVPGFDFASIGLFTGALLTTVAVRNWDFGRLLPIAHKTLIDNISDAMIVVSPDDRVVDINARGSELFGIERSSVGEPLAECLSPEVATAPPFVKENDGEVVFERDQMQRVYRYQVSPVTFQAAQVGRTITFRDITEQKEQEMLLRDATIRAQSERDGKRLVTELLLASSSRHVVAEKACQLLVEAYEYEAVWVIWTDAELDPASAVTRENVDRLETTVVRPLAARVFDSGELETAKPGGDDEIAAALREQQVAGVRAFPITYERLTTGVLCAVSTDGLPETARQTTEQMATALGFKRNVDDQQAALVSDHVDEISIQIDGNHLLSTATADRSVPVDVVETYHAGEDIVYMIHSESGIDDLETSLRAHEHVVDVTAVSVDPVLLAVRVQAVTVSAVLAGFGGVTRTIRGEAGSVTITVEFAPRTDVRAALDAVSDDWPTARMTKRQRRPTTLDALSPADTLTQRQEDALRAATLLGFFDRPQRARAEDVAEALGVSRSTALQHIRRAEAKVFEDLFSSEPRLRARTPESDLPGDR